MEALTTVPDFWQDRENAQKVIDQISARKEVLRQFATTFEFLGEVQALWDLAFEADDEEMAGEARTELTQFSTQLEALELATLLSGPYDSHNAVLSMHAGAGGTESQDWVEMLLRMYTRYCERHGYKVDTLDYLPGDEAGVKSVTISVEGLNAYGYLKSERGVHRLVRISPFDSAGRRHTSFASVDVLPQVADDHDCGY